jgi:hypothetical protein
MSRLRLIQLAQQLASGRCVPLSFCTSVMFKICQSAATSAISPATRAATSPLPSCSPTAAHCPQERARGMFFPCTHLEDTWNHIYSISIITDSLTIMRTQTMQRPNIGLTWTSLAEPMCGTNNTIHQSARQHPLETRVCICHAKQTLDHIRSDAREFRPP